MNEGQIPTVEIVVQWLDDFEDLVFSLLLTSERVRLRCLQTGLVAAVMFLGLVRADMWAPLASTFAVTSCVSVGLWLAGLVAAQLLRARQYSTRVSRRTGA